MQARILVWHTLANDKIKMDYPICQAICRFNSSVFLTIRSIFCIRIQVRNSAHFALDHRDYSILFINIVLNYCPFSLHFEVIIEKHFIWHLRLVVGPVFVYLSSLYALSHLPIWFFIKFWVLWNFWVCPSLSKDVDVQLLIVKLEGNEWHR